MGYKYDPDYAVHPGETVKEFMDEAGKCPLMVAWGSIPDTSRVADAVDLGEEIAMIAACKRSIELKHAVVFSMAFSLPLSFWMNLQTNYDERLAAIQKKVEK